MSLCYPVGTQLPNNYAVAFCSAKSYLERHGISPAWRLPMARVQPGARRLRRIPLHAPMPLPEAQRALLTGPDGGQTFDWPYPQFTAPDDPNNPQQPI